MWGKIGKSNSPFVKEFWSQEKKVGLSCPPPPSSLCPQLYSGVSVVRKMNGLEFATLLVSEEKQRAADVLLEHNMFERSRPITTCRAADVLLEQSLFESGCPQNLHR
jgi:hypothetical protein